MPNDMMTKHTVDVAIAQITDKPAISVFGLGYVGAVSAACFAEMGHTIIGVDVSTAKVDAINDGQSPIVEKDLDHLLDAGVGSGQILATTDGLTAVVDTDVTLISVGTPTAADGGCDTAFIEAALDTIGTALRDKRTWHTVVMRCSIPPGTTREIVIPRLEAISGKRAGEDFGVAFNPEFLREGTAIVDFYQPPKTVIGTSDITTAQIVGGLYAEIDPNPLFCDIGVAEMVKYVDNTWHATKVSFANEVGRLCKAMQVDSHRVMDVFCQDTKLNLSPYYLKPGFAFGGSCLPKEVRAMQHLAQSMGADVPLIESLMATNSRQISIALDMIRDLAPRTVAFLGVAFKPNTDDLRESPTLELMAGLQADGVTLKSYDPNLRLGDGLRQHYAYMRHARPHLQATIDALPTIARSDAKEAIEGADVIVVSHATERYRRAIADRHPTQHVVDLARLFASIPNDPTYHGIGW